MMGFIIELTHKHGGDTGYICPVPCATDEADFVNTMVRTETRRTAPKAGRNDPCACGSGKKYKKCCGGAAVN